MHSDSLNVVLDLSNPRVLRETAKVAASVPGLALQGRETASADILLLEMSGDAASLFGKVEQSLYAGSFTEVFLAGSDPTPDLLIRAIRSGVSEFLSLPLSRDELAQAVDRFRARHARLRTSGGSACKAVAVAGVRPGVGATTVALNLAVELNRRHPGKVLLLDLATPGEIPYFLDLEYSYTWADVVRNIERLDDTFIQSLLARHSSGLAVLPASPEPGRIDAAILEQFLAVASRGFEAVVADVGPFDESGQAMLRSADMPLVVFEPSLPCLAHVRKVLDLMNGDERLRLVLSGQTRDCEIDAPEVEEVLGRPLAAVLPFDRRSALSALNQGRALLESAPKSGLAKALAALADGLAPAKARQGFSLSGILKRFRKDEAAPAATGHGARLEAV